MHILIHRCQTLASTIILEDERKRRKRLTKSRGGSKWSERMAISKGNDLIDYLVQSIDDDRVRELGGRTDVKEVGTG